MSLDICQSWTSQPVPHQSELNMFNFYNLLSLKIFVCANTKYRTTECIYLYACICVQFNIFQFDFLQMRTWFNRTTDFDNNLKWWKQKRCTAVHFAFGIKYRVLATFTLCCFFWFEDFSNYTSQTCSHTHNNKLHRSLAFRRQTIFFFHSIFVSILIFQVC